MSDRGRGRGGGGYRGRGDGGGRGRGDGGFRGRGRGDGGGSRGGSDGSRGAFRGGSESSRGAFGGRGGRGGFGAPPAPVEVFRNGSFPPPDPAVTALEDSSVKNLSVALSATSLDDKLPRRPGYGTEGRKIVLSTNFFKLTGTNPSKSEFHRYSVTLQPDNEIPKPKRKRIIQLLLQRSPFKDVTCSSDWAQVIISTAKLDLGASRQSYDIEWYPADGQPLPARAADESESTKKARKRNSFTVLVESIGDVSLSELMKDLSFSVSGGTYPKKMEIIQALNIMLSHGPSTDSNIVTVGQNKYYPFQGHAQAVILDLTQGLVALRGYFSSVRTSVNRILLNVNVATGAFYKAGPLLDLMGSFCGGPPWNVQQQIYLRLSSFVKKLRIETNYIVDKDKDGNPKKGKGGAPVKKRKVHTIFCISVHGKNATNMKFTTGGKEYTVQAYFLEKHGMRLAYPQAPLVNHGTKDEAKWVPAELCTVLPGQVARRMLTPDQTRNMIEFAARSPFENARSIMGDGLQVTKIAPVAQGLNTHLTKFGIKVDPNMLTVHGRILNAPKLLYKGNFVIPRDGKWNLSDKNKARPFAQGTAIPSWNCLIINEGRYDTIRGDVGSLLGDFRQTLVNYGVNMGPVTAPRFVQLDPGDIHNKNFKTVYDIVDRTVRKFPAKPQFLYVVLPSDNAFIYDLIKFLFDVVYGIPNVCNIGKKVTKEKGQAQYFANVALKFNLKKGGANHYIPPDELKPLDDRTIIFGIDVTHPSPGSDESAPSIAGVVASCDGRFCQYPASVRTQKGREEMVQGLEEMILERLRLWQKANKGLLPNKVIVYRDGVSEGQYALVLRDEYPAFVAAFTKLYGGEKKHPKISIITVGKRHHTRFYPTKKEEADGRTGNALPGTVVDRGVTGERLFDFYLIAHQGLQGTSKPCHYVVLKDENKLGADQLQKLTHNLCYTFGRATRSVSLCPPAYYADLLCERGRSYLHQVLKGGDSDATFDASKWQGGVHAAVQDTMFYL